jgi:hypothetical protein
MTAKRRWRLSGIMILVVGFCLGTLAGVFSPAVGGGIWLLSWAVSAVLLIGSVMIPLPAGHCPRCGLPHEDPVFAAEYRAALEQSRAEVARLAAEGQP